MKYVLLAGETRIFPHLLERIPRPGLYSWVAVFKGKLQRWAEYRTNPGALNENDIVHINLAAKDIGLASKVAEFLDSSTKLVVNMDYSIERLPSELQHTGKSLHTLAQDLNVADMAFGVEPFQVAFMNYLMKEKHPCLLSHPIDVESMSKLSVPVDKRMQKIAYHFRNGSTIAQSIIDAPSILLGWDIETDMPMPNEVIPVPLTTWDSYIEALKHCTLGFEYRFHHAASRFVLECASLGIPVLSSDYSYLTRKIWPSLSFEPHEFEAMHRKLEEIAQDDEMRIMLANNGMKNVQWFNLDHSRERFLIALSTRQ